MFQTNLAECLEIPVKALAHLKKAENHKDPLPPSFIGITRPMVPTAEQQDILQCVHVALNFDQEETKTSARKILNNITDVVFALDWLRIVSRFLNFLYQVVYIFYLRQGEHYPQMHLSYGNKSNCK